MAVESGLPDGRSQGVEPANVDPIVRGRRASVATGSGARRSGFRPDIEGLRALAVLPILLCHARVRGFPGGFIGVDIFLVISGYLITGILLRDAAAGTFSLTAFYRRRVLRLFPALMGMLVGSTTLAFLALTPPELVAYARSLISTVLFFSNVQFYADTGYFTSAAASRPLLHTWSLAIEEQFYIFWPLLLLLCAPRGRRTTRAALAALVVISFSLAVWAVQRNMAAAFYLIPFRAWELGVGGLLALVGERRRLPAVWREIVAAAGLVAILICIKTYGDAMFFPGLAALPPCLGTCAIIFAGPFSSVGRLLAIAPLRFVGRISYSLYLWHWPVIVFAGLWLFLSPIDPWVIAGEIFVSLDLAWLSYVVLERGLRAPLARLPRATILRGAMISMAAWVAIAGALIAAHGFESRFPADAVALAHTVDRDDEASYRRGSCFVVAADDRFDPRACLAMRPGVPSLLLVGDSTAAHLWPGLASQASRYATLQATMAGCPPELDRPDSLPCTRFFRSILHDWAPAHPTGIVILAGNWATEDIALIPATLADLRARGLDVLLVGPMPRYTAALPRLLFFALTRRSPDVVRANLDPTIWPIDQALATAATDAGVHYVSPLRLLCNAGSCRTLARAGMPMQFDYVHLTVAGSRLMVAAMRPAIDRALADGMRDRRRSRD